MKDHHNTFFSSKDVTNHSSGTKYSIQKYISYHNCSPTYSSFFHNISSIQEPKSFKEAIQRDCWKEAMQHELDFLESNETWSLMDLPPGKRPIGCKRVFKAKHKPDNTIDRYKTRLVAKGYTQTKGIEYFETFSSVVKITTIRFIFSLASAKGWILHQLDVNNVFLHGDLDEEIYMTPPAGLTLSYPIQVCKLRKSLYRLKQKSRQWNSKLTQTVIQLGYVQIIADHSLFIHTDNHSFNALLILLEKTGNFPTKTEP